MARAQESNSNRRWGIAVGIALLVLLSGITIMPPASSNTPTPTFDLLYVPGDYETIEEAYSWLAEGGTIKVGSGVHLVNLDMKRAANIVSVGGPGSTTLKSRISPGTLFSTSADFTITGFTVQGNTNTFLLCQEPAERVKLEGNIIIDSKIDVRMNGFVFQGNSMTGFSDLVLSGDSARLDDNDFGPSSHLNEKGKNNNILSCDFNEATAHIEGENCIVDKCSFHDISTTCISCVGGDVSISGCTFRNVGTGSDCPVDGYGTFQDNTFDNCEYGLDLGYTTMGSWVYQNTFTNCQYPLVISQQKGPSVIENKIWNDPLVTQINRGLQVDGSFATITGNVISNTYPYGMLLSGDNFAVRDNVVKVVFTEYYPKTSRGIDASLIASIFSGNKVLEAVGEGIRVSGSGTEYRDNLIQDCSTGINVMDGSKGNQFIHNDLIGNNVSAVDACLDETWDQNLFSDYHGPDANGDGIGDLPHIISGGINQDLHPRIYSGPLQLGKVNLGIAPITFPASAGDWDKYLIYDFDYYQQLGEKLADYLREVSYGSIDVNVQVLREAGGEMFSLAESSSVVRTWTIKKFSEKAIKVMDPHVDFRAYDYTDQGGEGVGVVALVAPFRAAFDPITRQATSAFCASLDYNGGWLTDEEVGVDNIYTYAQASGGPKYITHLAHEFSHFIGKLLITHRDGAKNGMWWLPDEYLMGNVQYTDSIMGALVSGYPERVHLDSYCKEWLGWLSYHEVELGQECDLVPLSTMSLNDQVMRYSYSFPLASGKTSTGYYILEHRYRSVEGMDWDRDATLFQSVNIYDVQTTPGQNDRINLVGRLVTLGKSTVIPDLKLSFTLTAINGTICTVKVEAVDMSSVTGASLLPRGKVLNDVDLHMPHMAIYEAMPDIDLHAYAADGKHVGMNYKTGEYEVEIPGAISSGDLTNGREFIYVNSSYEPRFVVDSRDMQEFMNTWPEALQYTDGREEFNIGVGRYGEDGELYTSEMEMRELSPNESYEVPYEIQQNQDGSYSADITDEGMFHVIVNSTGLLANTNWSITVDGLEHNSSISLMDLILPEGMHSYTIGEVQGFIANPSSGTFQVSGSGTIVTIAFTKNVSPSPDPYTLTLMLLGGVLVAITVVLVAFFSLTRGRKPPYRQADTLMAQSGVPPPPPGQAYCPRCGAPDGGLPFCGKCGTRLR